MSGAFAAQHSRALASIKRKGGVALSFTRKLPGTLDATTNTFTGASSSSIAGYAIEVQSDPEQLEQLSLLLKKSHTFFFVPTTYGLLAVDKSFVQPNDLCAWNNDTWSARDVRALAPDGVVITARIVVTM